jgi:putative membrane protein
VSTAARRVPLVLALALVLVAVVYPLTSGGPVRDAVSWTIVLLGAALSVAHAWVARGRRTGLAVLGVGAATAVCFEAVGLATGFPYGEYRYSTALGPTLLGVPFLVPLAWLMLAWPSRVLAARLTAGVRARWRAPARVVLGAALFAAWDVVLDPQMVQAGYWTWAHPHPGLPGIGTVPLTNLAGWLLAGLVLMALLDVVVARTALPGPPRVGDAAPLLALAWMTLGGALAHAGWLGLPGSAAWGAALAVPVLVAVALQERRRPHPAGALRTRLRRPASARR